MALAEAKGTIKSIRPRGVINPVGRVAFVAFLQGRGATRRSPAPGGMSMKRKPHRAQAEQAVNGDGHPTAADVLAAFYQLSPAERHIVCNSLLHDPKCRVGEVYATLCVLFRDTAQDVLRQQERCRALEVELKQRQGQQSKSERDREWYRRVGESETAEDIAKSDKVNAATVRQAVAREKRRREAVAAERLRCERFISQLREHGIDKYVSIDRLRQMVDERWPQEM